MKKKKASWELMRLCRTFLKENDVKWKEKDEEEKKRNNKKADLKPRKSTEKEEEIVLIQKKIEETFKKIP